MTFGLQYKVTGQFFDRLPVQKMLTDFEKKSLSRIGANLRRTSRGSIKFRGWLKRKKGETLTAYQRRMRSRVSPAGSPAFTHTRDKFRTIKNILFAYDSAKHSVVVGPRLFRGRSSSRNSDTVPATLEAGGSVTVRETVFRRGKKTTQRRQVVVKPRPTMTLAWRKEQPNVPRILAGRAA